MHLPTRLLRFYPAFVLAAFVLMLAACETGSSPLARSDSRSPSASNGYERPGLGTAAGDTRWSHVSRAQFFRRSSSPDAVASFHYNDEEGAKAMAGQLGGGSRRSSLFAVAGDRLRTGLISGNWQRDVLPSLEADGRRIVVGESGSTYRIRLENRTSHRIEVLVSVDGLNVLTGTAAGYAQHGYVLAPHQSADIDGFRVNDDKVKEFRFGSVSESKAAKSGGARNVGVIGLAVFDEDEVRQKAFLRGEQLRREDADAFPVRLD